MPEPFELARDEKGQYVLKRPGQDDVTDVRVRRSFPWSNPRQFISIRNSEGKELLLIENLDDLPPDTRRAVEEAIADASFIPTIRRIDDIDIRFGHQEWRVQTDRGPAEFRVQEREDIRFLGDGRFSVKDADGNVYELPRLDQLDDYSRRKLEVLL